MKRRRAFDRFREWAGGSVPTDEVRERIDAELEEGWRLARDHATPRSAKARARETLRAFSPSVRVLGV